MSYDDLFTEGKDMELARQRAEQTEEELNAFAIQGSKITDSKGTVTGARLLGPGAKPLVDKLFDSKSPDKSQSTEASAQSSSSSSSESDSSSSDSDDDDDEKSVVKEEQTPIQNNLKTSKGPSLVPSGLQTLGHKRTPSISSIQKLSTNKMAQLESDSEAMHNMMGDPTLKAIRGDVIRTHSAVGYLQDQIGVLSRKVAELTEIVEPLGKLHHDIKYLTNLLEHADLATANPSRPGSGSTRFYGHTGVQERETHIGMLASREKTARTTFSLLSSGGERGGRGYGEESEESIMERIPIMLAKLSSGARAEMASEYMNRNEDFDAEMFLTKVVSMIEMEQAH